MRFQGATPIVIRAVYQQNRAPILVSLCLAALMACSSSDDDAPSCVDTMLTGSLPVVSENIDVTGMGISYQPAPGREAGSNASELEDQTFGWVSTIDEEIMVQFRASAGVVFDEGTLSQRQIYVSRGCDEEPFGFGVAGGGFGTNVSEGDLLVMVVKGCSGDCDLTIDFPPPTTDD